MPVQITRNRAQCNTCKEIVESKTRHDFVTCSCGKLSVDGGTDYLKRSGGPYTELSEHTGQTHLADYLTRPSKQKE